MGVPPRLADSHRINYWRSEAGLTRAQPARGAVELFCLLVLCRAAPVGFGVRIACVCGVFMAYQPCQVI